MNIPVCPVHKLFRIERNEDHSCLSMLDGVMREISNSAAAGNFNIGDQQRCHTRIFKKVLDLDHPALSDKTKIVFGILELNVGAVVLCLCIQLRQKKYPAHK